MFCKNSYHQIPLYVHEKCFQVQSYPPTLYETMVATLAAQQELSQQQDVSRVEYYTVPTNSTQLQVSPAM
jgi:hypothetical protein